MENKTLVRSKQDYEVMEQQFGKVVMASFFHRAGLMSVGHARLSLTFSSELVREPQLDQKKISTPSFLHCRAQSGSKGPFFLSSSA